MDHISSCAAVRASCACITHGAIPPRDRVCSLLVPIVGGWLRKGGGGFPSPLYALATASARGQSYTNRLPCFHSLPSCTETKQSGVVHRVLCSFFFLSLPPLVMDYRQLLLNQANALAAAGCYGSAGTGGSGAGYPSAAATSAAAAAAAAYSHAAARTYSYRLWTLANVLSDPCMHSQI